MDLYIFNFYFGFLKLDLGNQIWKFMCRYFGKFLAKFSIFYAFFFGISIFYRIKILLSLKFLRTTGKHTVYTILDYSHCTKSESFWSVFQPGGQVLTRFILDSKIVENQRILFRYWMQSSKKADLGLDFENQIVYFKLPHFFWQIDIFPKKQRH